MKPTDIERNAVEIVANVAPWLAPLPTAWLIYERTMIHLQWPVSVAAIAGLTLELLGVGILATWLELYGYNRSKRKSDSAAPTWMAGILVALYFATAEALTFALDVWPVAAIVAPALFPVLSVAAFVLLALRASHKQMLSDIERVKAEAKAERERKKVAKNEMERPASEPETQLAIVQTLECDDCDRTFSWPGQGPGWYKNERGAKAALSGHSKKHLGKHERQYLPH